MSQEKSDPLRGGYQALSRTGEWPDDGLLAPDFELHQDPFVDTAKAFQGPGAPGEIMRGLQGAFREISFEVERVIEAAAGTVVVLARVRGRGRASGTAIDKEQAHVWTFSGDRAIRMRIYARPAEALKAVGLEKQAEET